ncbi:MAG: CAP domain-containing protein [Patescibacteria group bacterium]|jgi:hypothetical protein
MKEKFLKHFWHETWYQKFSRHFRMWFKKHFIPHQDNGYLPQALSTRHLRFYAIALIFIKVFLTVLLFVVYPSYLVFSAKITDGIIELANQARTEMGISGLTINSLLTEAAQEKANDMITKGYFSHTAPNGDKPWVWLDDVGYAYYAAGENLAMDFSSAESVHRAFMNSPSHRKNIINPRYEEIGVGIAYGKIDGKDTAVLVQYFGSTHKQIVASVPKDIQQKAVAYENAAMSQGQEVGLEVADKQDIFVKEWANNPYAIQDSEIQMPNGGKVLQEIESNAPVVVAVPETSRARDLVNNIIFFVDKFFYAFLAFLIVALTLKIFIQIRVQHPHIIGYTATLILLVFVLATSKFHFVEKIVTKVMEIV